MSWTHSEGIDLLAAALAKAQVEIKAPKRTHKAKIQTRSGPGFEYAYSTLDDLVDAVRVPLASNGLSFVQALETVHAGDMVWTGVETTILHASGQWVSCGQLLLPAGDTAQLAGASASYARRYSLSAALGIAPDDDTDGAGVEHKPKPRAVPTTTSGMTPVGAIPAPPVSREPGDEDDIDEAMPDSHREAGLMAEDVTPTAIKEAKGQGWEARFITFSNKQEAGLFLNDPGATQILQMIYESHQSGKPLAVQFERSKKDAKKLKIVSVLWQEDFVQ